MNTLNKKQHGFTIVELLISTAVFSVVLLLCATAIVQVGRMFYKGIIVNSTQNISRSIINEVSQAIQFGGGESALFLNTGTKDFTYGTLTIPVQAYCLGEIRYSYFLATKSLGVDDTDNQLPHILWKDRLTNGICEPADITQNLPSPNGVELLTKNMRLPAFSITAPTPTNSVYTIALTVAHGETDDLFERTSDGPPPTYDYGKCTTRVNGGQFCAVSTINTFVARRL